MANSLLLISTPLGNPEDITLRALKTLFASDVLLCEDTRKTRHLLDYYLKQDYFSLLTGSQSFPRLVSFYEHNEDQRIPQVIAWINQGLTVSLVPNAGTPTISDPGFRLVRECVSKNIQVISVPGASAVIAALSVSGLPTDKFLFLGFLPKKSGKRQKLLENLRQVPLSLSVVLYESPYRARTTITDLREILGENELVIVRELTKIRESVERHSFSSWIDKLQHQPPKGELVLIFSLNWG